MRTVIPLSQRKPDIFILIFFWFNLVVVTYMIDLEQLVIQDPSNFVYPLWPPKFIIDAVHWWGRTFDPALLERPVWWKMTIWIDQLFYGPFYMFAIYAYTKGKEWIRIPSIIYASVMITGVTIILGEETFGSYKSPHLAMVYFANASWILFPLFIIYRMWSSPHPFTQETASPDER